MVNYEEPTKRPGGRKLPLEGGDRWVGLDTLRVLDVSTGQIILDGHIITDMDIDPHHNRVTMMVSSDIQNDDQPNHEPEQEPEAPF